MKQPGPKKERALPDVQTGDCFAYQMEDGWHHLVVLERCKSDFLYVAVMAGSTPERLSAADLADKPVYTAKLYSAETMLGKSKLKKIGCVDIAPGLYAGQFPKPWLLKGCKADFAGQNGFALHYVVIAGLSYRVIYDLKQQYPAMTLERLLSQRHGQPGTLTGPLANFGEKGNVLDDCISCLTEEQFLFFCFSSMGMGNIMDPQQYEDCIGIPMNDLHE